VTSTPHPLTYDTLPPLSTLRREVTDAGKVITISLPAGEVTAPARSRAMRATAVSSAIMCAALLLLAAAMIGPVVLDPNRRALWLDRRMIAVLLLCAGVFVLALFLLVWQVRSSQMLDKLRRAREQTTVLSVRGGEVLLETSGPLGQLSSTLRPRATRIGRWGGGAIYGLELTDEQQRRFMVFIGLSKEELMWIARAIESATDAPVSRPRQT